MSGMAALLAGHNPPAVYQWHSAAHVEDVQHCVEKAGWRFRYLDGWTVEDAEGFLKAAAVALDFPAEFAGTFDAMAESLADVTADGAHGVVVLWDGWSPLARHDEEAFARVLETFRGRVQAQADGPFAVVMRGDGPPLDVPELPVKH